MKNILKRATGLLMAGAMTASLAVSASAAEDDIMLISSEATEVTGSYQTYMYTQEVHPLANLGNVSITPGTLTDAEGTHDIYLVAMHGLESTQVGEADDLINCILSAFDLGNTYLMDLINIMAENVPAGSNIVFAGHSLGGMVAQQAAATDALKDTYNIMYTVTFGSPLITEDCEGIVNRCTDTSDVVPYLSGYTLSDFDKQSSTRNEEHISGFTLNTHVDSYKDADTWGAYDAVGQKNGNVTMMLDDSATTYHHTPLLGFAVGSSIYGSIQVDGNYYGVGLFI